MSAHTNTLRGNHDHASHATDRPGSELGLSQPHALTLDAFNAQGQKMGIALARQSSAQDGSFSFQVVVPEPDAGLLMGLGLLGLALVRRRTA